MTRENGRAASVGERRPVGFAVLLVFGMGVPTLLTAAIGVLAPLIVADLGLTTAQFGALGTSVYLLAALVAPLVGGRIDRMDDLVALLLLLAISGLAIVGMSLAMTYAAALAAVAAAGVAEAANTPVTNRLLSRQGASRLSGLLMGLKQSGVKVSHLIAGALLPPLAVAIGWRNSLASSTLLVVGGIALATWLLPRPRARPQLRTTAAPRGKAPLPAGVWPMVAYAFLMALGQAPFQLYITLYAVQRVGMTLAQGGLAFALASTIAIGARVAWGMAADRRAVTDRAPFILAVGSALSTFAILGAEPGGPWLVWVGAIGIGVTASVWSTLVHLSIVQASALGGATARATGVVHMAFLAGMGLSPLVFGIVVDSPSGYRLGWLLAAVAFVAAAIVSMVAPGPSNREGSTTVPVS